jgi:hypothetical protein
MAALVNIRGSISKSVPKASQVLIDYEYWLHRKYGKTGTYLVNAKSFLRTYKHGGNVQSQLKAYLGERRSALQSILKRFGGFLATRDITMLINDLNEEKLPISNLYVKLFLASAQDRLRSKGSLSIYATVLNGYFNSIKDDVTRMNKRTVGKYVLSPTFSDYTKRLYKSVLKSFSEWVLQYQLIDSSELSREQRMVKRTLRQISIQSLREIASMHVVIPRTITSTYHKDSLTEKQRQRLLAIARSSRDRAIIALMAWNGLRSIEVLRLSVADLKFSQGKLAVWGKGRREKSKDLIKLSSVAKKEIYVPIKSNEVGYFPACLEPFLMS